MRTTLKRGVGRGAGANGNGRTTLPPAPPSAITRYAQPPRPPHSPFRLLRRILAGTFLVLLSIAGGVGGGAYLWFHDSVADVRAHSKAVKVAAKTLDVPLANHAAIALVLGYDHRANESSSSPSRSDTVMLI